MPPPRLQPLHGLSDRPPHRGVQIDGLRGLRGRGGHGSRTVSAIARGLRHEFGLGITRGVGDLREKCAGTVASGFRDHRKTDLGRKVVESHRAQRLIRHGRYQQR